MEEPLHKQEMSKLELTDREDNRGDIEDNNEGSFFSDIENEDEGEKFFEIEKGEILQHKF